jgi:inner membrane protein
VSRLAELGRAPLMRLLLIAGLALLLQVPGCLIGQKAWERQQSRDQATAEIAQTWGARQHLGGPILAVPFRRYGLDDKGKRVEVESGAIAVLPERLEVSADARVETLRRGLFQVPVYRSRLQLTGRFGAPRAGIGALVPHDALLWERAQLVVRLTDVHAIDRVERLQWAGHSQDFQGGGGVLGVSGLHAPLAGISGDAPFDFSIELAVRGSEGLYFMPSARAMSVRLHSAWPHPKFDGGWLPDQREVSKDGFNARWNLSSIAGGLPTAWKFGGADDASRSASFGVQLLYPVDPYRMGERSLKYDLLFIGLTFLVVWLFEQRVGRAVHPVQYLMLGAALCLFYLLELSLAEHFGFATAYALAAAAVTAQVSLYARAVLRGLWPALGLMAIVAALYALLYVLLGEEDYALLVGSAVLFAALSAVMYLTRRISWDRSLGAPSPGGLS